MSSRARSRTLDGDMTTGTLSHLPHRTRVVIAGGGVAALEARGVPAFDHGVTFGPGSFEDVLDDLRSDFAGDVAIVVPRGVSWSLPAYELALMTASWSDARGVAVRVVTHEQAPLDIFGQ